MRTLTGWILRVKPVRAELVSACLAGLLVALGVLAINLDETAHEDRATELGEQLAAGLAQLAAEPLATRDRIALGVLANRVVELEDIVGATIYTVDDDVLAISGEPRRGAHVTRPITQENNIVGYVRLTLSEPAPEPVRPTLWTSLLLALLVPPLVVGIRHLPWHRLTAAWSGLAPRRAPARGHAPPIDPAESTETSPPEPAPPVAERRALLAVNLFNQLSLPPRLRDAELARAARLAEAAADLYTGRVTTLPGTGMLLEFEEVGDPERPFQVLCAAFLLARLLDADDAEGRFRFGLHQALMPPGEDIAPDDPAVQDAALLSAVAKPGTIAVSAELFARVSRPERVLSQQMANPLLHQLESTEPSACLVGGLDATHDEVIEQQARELGYAAPATDRASTF